MQPRSRLVVALVVASGLAIPVLAIPVLARAHAILVASDPAPGGAVASGTVSLRLRYNSRIDAERSRLTLTRPDGSTAVLATDRAPAPDLLLAHVSLPPGAYSVRWLVLATDGHITRGDVPFTVAPR